MTDNAATRMLAVPSLSNMLPPGTEGGKEFGRIVDLLLFYDAKQQGSKFSAFNDAAGDYAGLDSFGSQRLEGTTGYQYKFFPSPLSSKHRSEIEQSLRWAIDRKDRSGLKHWILVTPDDLLESGRKRGGGDVSWFEGLQTKYPDVEIEHYGHTKLQGLFLQAPYLCLYYYPSLLPGGAIRRNSVQSTRQSYDSNIRQQNGRIEFVGMSVYKEEATRGVPIEHIYIPLSVVREEFDHSDENTPRNDPLSLLEPGKRSVILGDPGSGKSTLLSFLSIAGISPAIQERYGAAPDERLPVKITLRRCADELKVRKNLSILDYIVEVTRAEFSLGAADEEFFLFYLSSGRGIVLFDGLDELPTSQFKKIVRDRIAAFCTTYPGNTTITTSRIVGYEHRIRFPESFSHYKMADLRVTEINSFIGDWYKARVENDTERQANIDDLVRIISHPENAAIRELSKNPLLLTIVALVHRIDAVLPDERVVLYQKCTETLLNTWYKWKFKEDDERTKGRVERRNRRRIESIAYWMQCRASDAQAGRAVVPYDELKMFLTEHINSSEFISTEDESAEDQADEFLKFIKSRTGLIIEVGDGRYSFLHLTFQEYLSATYLIAQSELRGVTEIWTLIGDQFSNPKWREVVRLLIASLKSDDSQLYLINQTMNGDSERRCLATTLLLGGLLVDGIEPAESQAAEIVLRLLHGTADATNADDLRAAAGTLRAWLVKNERNHQDAHKVFEEMDRKTPVSAKAQLILSGLASGLSEDVLSAALGPPCAPSALDIYSRLMSDSSNAGRLAKLNDFYDKWSYESPEANLVAAASQGITLLIDEEYAWKRMFERGMIVLTNPRGGPHQDYFYNTCAIVIAERGLPDPAILSTMLHIDSGGTLQKNHLRDDKNEDAIDPEQDFCHQVHDIVRRNAGRSRRDDGVYAEVRRRLMRSRVTRSAKSYRIPRSSELDLSVHRNDIMQLASSEIGDVRHYGDKLWRGLRASPNFGLGVISPAIGMLGLTPKAQWEEVSRQVLGVQMPKIMARGLDKDSIAALIQCFAEGRDRPVDRYKAAWLLLLNIWVNVCGGGSDMGWTDDLENATRDMNEPALVIAHLLRRIWKREDGAASELTAHASDRNSATGRLLREVCWA